MKYVDILTKLKEQGAEPVLPFDGFSENNGNGYVAIPDTLPLDYLDPIYNNVHTKPIGGLSFEGYSWRDKYGEHHIARFDMNPSAGSDPLSAEEQSALDEIKSKYVTPTLGFDNDHYGFYGYEPIEFPGDEGVEFLSEQLRELSFAMSINDAIGNFLDNISTKER